MFVSFTSSRLVIPAALLSLFVAAGCSTTVAAEPQKRTVQKDSKPEDAGSPTDGAQTTTSVCESLCSRRVTCDPATDKDTCKSSCENDMGSLVSKLRSDYANELVSCLDDVACRDLESGSAVTACADESRARLAVTAGTTEFCDAYAAAATKCGQKLDKATCIDTTKVYSDATLAALNNCLGKKCADISACIDAATGTTATAPPPSTQTPPPSAPTCSAQLTYGDSVCDACMNSACCAQDNACANNPSCVDWNECAVACTTTACVTSCDNAYPSGRALYDTLAACMSSSCPASCGE